MAARSGVAFRSAVDRELQRYRGDEDRASCVAEVDRPRAEEGGQGEVDEAHVVEEAHVGGGAVRQLRDEEAVALWSAQVRQREPRERGTWMSF